MAKKPTYEELDQRVKKFEKEAIEFRRAEKALSASVRLEELDSNVNILA